ncbi:MAG: hypothetical protein HY266_04905 [Deltaproteobacteria bacterium]|nr:hypothetical protein [Deltaproteobacteria bacterium]
MTAKEFINRIAHSKGDFLQEFLDMLEKTKTGFCAIGGLAVNAYAEPVVSLDLDVVIAADKTAHLLDALKKRYSVAEFPNSVNVTEPASDLRIQIQTDSRYQSFIKRAAHKKVLGYEMPVAAIEDVLQGKIWAAMDETRRASKRQKDMADIMRLVEAREDLISLVPESLRKRIFI